MLAVAVRHPLGRIVLEADFRAGPGLTALVGPSGAGKTSLLEAIAGLLRPAQGSIAFDGEALSDTARGVWVPPHRRRFGYVPQDQRLFPHLSVRHNLLYGRWFAARAASGPPFDDVVGMLDLGGLLARRPGRLSGGEKQRVALGRALLANPRLLLLDEPLASVDAARKQQILPYLDRVLQETGVPVLYVTHVFAEIGERAEHAVVVDEGRVIAAGPPGAVRHALERTMGL